MMFEKPCACCNMKFSREPARERLPANQFVARLCDETDAAYENREREIYKRLSRHEAGHAIAAVAHNRGVAYVTIGAGAPHVAYENNRIGEKTIDAFSLIHAAGMVADGAALPSWSELGPALRRAREVQKGVCDICKLSELIVATAGNRSNREMIEGIYSTFETCSLLFKSPQWSGALESLADAIEHRTMLTGAEIDEILSPFDLATPLKQISPIW